MKRIIRTYRSASGRDDVASWFADLGTKEKAKVLVWIDHVRQQPREAWGDAPFP
jgi:hypothetical protein